MTYSLRNSSSTRGSDHTRLHLAAVYATVAREVNEERLVHLGGICLGLTQVEETLQSERQFEHAVLDALLGEPTAHRSREPRRRCRHHEVLRLDRGHISRQGLQRAPTCRGSYHTTNAKVTMASARRPTDR